MTGKQSVRIDKFLWAVRIFKTRNLAAEACKKGKVIIGNIHLKPSRLVTAGEIITVIKPPVSYSYRITDPIENRISAKLVPMHIEDLTPAGEKEKLHVKTITIFGYREKGLGRPTKKERRSLQKLREDLGGN
jgi:ribosome-associated heat shock protein Hsp15